MGLAWSTFSNIQRKKHENKNFAYEIDVDHKMFQVKMVVKDEKVCKKMDVYNAVIYKHTKGFLSTG